MTTDFPACYGCFVNPMPWNIPQTFPAPIYDNLPPPPPTPPFSAYFIPDTNGLTPEEREIVEMLAQAFNKFVALGGKHPADNSEFCTAIHDAQKTIAMRVARRVNPDVWKQYPEESVDNV